MPKDIVCNMEINENQAAGKSEYKGLTYYFCAETCKDRFNAEPETYLKKLSWWKRFLSKIAAANKQIYGNESPKCCK